MARGLVRIGLWLLLALALLVAVIFGAAILFGGDSTTRLVGVVLTVVALGIAYAAAFGLSRLHPKGWEEKQRRRREAEARPPDDIEGEVVIAGRGKLSREARLQLTPQGFDATHPRRSVTHAWNEVEKTFPTRIGGYHTLYAPPNAVAFKLRDGPLHQPSRSERITRWLMNADEMLPGLYERSATDVAELM